MPLINEAAPAFSANTTHGTRSLADYKGKWLILFSHPADFTPDWRDTTKPSFSSARNICAPDKPGDLGMRHFECRY
jgi:peroxiredoxin